MKPLVKYFFRSSLIASLSSAFYSLYQLARVEFIKYFITWSNVNGINLEAESELKSSRVFSSSSSSLFSGCN
jgi:hypothetical protein